MHLPTSDALRTRTAFRGPVHVQKVLDRRLYTTRHQNTQLVRRTTVAAKGNPCNECLVGSFPNKLSGCQLVGVEDARQDLCAQNVTYLHLEEDEPIRGDEKGEGEQVQHKCVRHDQASLGHQRPVDHLVHVPGLLRRTGKRQVLVLMWVGLAPATSS